MESEFLNVLSRFPDPNAFPTFHEVFVFEKTSKMHNFSTTKYICQLCQRRYDGIYHYIGCIMQHMNQQLYACPACFKTSSDDEMLYAHIIKCMKTGAFKNTNAEEHRRHLSYFATTTQQE